MKKKDKGIVLGYIKEVTGYSNIQVKILASKYLKGQLKLKRYKKATGFHTKYTSTDIEYLIKTDNAHEILNGNSTKKILEDEFKIYGKPEYENIKDISVSHIYNIRKGTFYQNHVIKFTKTKSVARAIGERRKMESKGNPGYLNVDTVHQGDKNGEKGIYHINIVDQSTQFEFIASVEVISERYLEPILKALIRIFPFIIKEFHTDNGSEYINRIVVKLLKKLHIKLLKSRARKTTDNAQVEGKNNIIRKHMGHIHIPKMYAGSVNTFYLNMFNEYLNYHRPCGYPTVKVDNKGKITKEYKEYMTPYQRLKNIDKKGKYLKDGITYAILDKIEMRMSHNEYAYIMQDEKIKLFKKIFKL
ncbi:MAG: integrase [Patescibacteria group bacterium]